MNFLSHYYFDRKKDNPYEVLGMLLPDLLKNADKNWNPHPEKKEYLFENNHHQEILTGWRRHLAVDKFFHNSAFFIHHQHQIKLCLKDLLIGSPVKPFFLGHVSLELLLDSLLITERLIRIDSLYKALHQIEISVITSFLSLNGIDNPNPFFKFFDAFKKEEYLHSYAETEKISYALKRICMRIWDNPFTAEQEEALTKSLITYKDELSKDFIFIFEMIDARIN
jgi:acyl carrier protein phosphodiesterase